jgi:hypothetical protein
MKEGGVAGSENRNPPAKRRHMARFHDQLCITARSAIQPARWDHRSVVKILLLIRTAKNKGEAGSRAAVARTNRAFAIKEFDKDNVIPGSWRVFRTD